MQCHGLQCGFCTPGMLMTARALLNANPDPTDGEIREAISGQIAARRCTPVTDQRGTADYTRHLADELTRRALRRAIARCTADAATLGGN